VLTRLTLALAALAHPVDAAVVHFCWAGANGYSMTGTLEFPDELLEADVVTQWDVTGFRITGFKDGSPIGSWDWATRQRDDVFYLRYLPREMRFATGGEVPGTYDQAWNADGTAADCDADGFGFNAANYAQDFCLGGVWIEESGVPPETPFPAQAEPVADPTCRGPELLSKRER
jgi:hypothetical protein